MTSIENGPISWAALGVSVRSSRDEDDSADDSVSGAEDEEGTGAPEGPPTQLHRRRTLYLIRHGEAEHNVLEAAAQRTAEREGEALRLPRDEIRARMEVARQEVLRDWQLRDASLTARGCEQARDTRRRLARLIADGTVHYPTEAMCSPLSRCLQTCRLLLEDSDVAAHIRPEISERRTLLPPDTAPPWREMLRYTRDSDPFTVEHFERRAATGRPDPDATVCESKEKLRERAGEMFDLLMECDHRHVLVVSHKGFLRELERGLLRMPDAPLFENCELRVYRVVFTMGDRSLVGIERIA